MSRYQGERPASRPPGVVVRWLPVLAGAVVPLVAAAALVPVRGRLGRVDLALLLVTVTVAIACWGRRLAAAASAVSAAVGFDFFLTTPYRSLAISHRGDVVTAALMFLAAILAGDVAARRHRQAAESREAVDHLHAVAELVASGEPPAKVVPFVAQRLEELLHLRECRFSDDPAPASMPRMRADGSVLWGEIVWGAASLGLPDKGVELPVRSQGRPVGHYLLVPDVMGGPLSRQRRLVTVALADQAGACLAAWAQGPIAGPDLPRAPRWDAKGQRANGHRRMEP